MKKIRLPISAFLLSVSLIWIWYSKPPADLMEISSIEAGQIGFLAPDFKLSSLDSGDISLSDLRGSPVIVNFWASWCPPCKAEMPAFQQAYQEYSGSDIKLIAVNATNQDSLAEVTQFIDQHKITFPIALDLSGTVSRDYLVHSLPTTYFIDKNGIIKDIIIGGPIPISLLRIQTDNLLAE